MNDTPPFKRNLEGLRLYYDVLNSKGYSYYEVDMIGTTAVSCECKAGGRYKKPCRHKDTAEQAELAFQATQRALSTTEEITLHDRIVAAPLNGDRSFQLLRR